MSCSLAAPGCGSSAKILPLAWPGLWSGSYSCGVRFLYVKGEHLRLWKISVEESQVETLAIALYAEG